MTTSIGSVTSTTQATSTSTTSSGASKPMDREAFLKLLVAQISHQDPLSPMEGTEFVSQLSQFAMVEQSIAQSASLSTLSTQVGGIANNDATAMVGKMVTMRGRAMNFDGLSAASTSVSLAGPAASVTANILDANGNIVRTLDLGAKPAGSLGVVWDGRTATGEKAAAGTYTLKVEAKDGIGAPVAASQDVTGIVKRVSFEKGYPELILENGASGSVADLVSVSQPTTTR